MKKLAIAIKDQEQLNKLSSESVWNELGISVCAATSEPEELFALLEKHEPQFLLLDQDNEIMNFFSDPYLTRQYYDWIKRAILHDLIMGNCFFDKTILNKLHLDDNTYQIVIYESFDPMQEYSSYNLADLLNTSNHGVPFLEHFEEEYHHVILLIGKTALEKFQNLILHYQTTPPQKNSPLDSLFMAYGRPVKNVLDIHLSYLDASSLINRRFFCEKDAHILGYESLPDLPPMDSQNTLSEKSPAYFCEAFCNHLQTFNRKKVSAIMTELKLHLIQSNADIANIRLFLSDMYLQIKEHMNLIYQTLHIPFDTNSEILRILNSNQYLYQNLNYLAGKFEMIMNTIGSPSRDSVLNDILYYIQHNYRSNLKLENIAPLFGYNSAYLGKIFNKTVGESFNTYIDRVRIEHSKELLSQNHLKVYEISEQIGYKNVDYFHKKFKKYVGISPTEYRKLTEK